MPRGRVPPSERLKKPLQERLLSGSDAFSLSFTHFLPRYASHRSITRSLALSNPETPGDAVFGVV